ncbi:HNH endonuclease signature motif containing protein [Marisediminicola antarctica]|uniref:HNH nuclease domain-containing protein n=1 Tax=Marisediminicola antarctica TaxID=674079 RepID=A0A7L5AI50_9MICO|nr:HNH endonuclease signature motif containing protein [Marisediminicola antarctica]QHO69722.1 hypothetical protein BHD05_08790 [Marisediminicola antarctica]
MEQLPNTLRDTADTVAGLGACAGEFTALDDASLFAAQRSVTALRRAVDTYAAWIAAAIAKHSDRALGHAGMAISAGFVSAEALIQSISGSTRAEAAKLVQIGTLLAETEAAEALAAADPTATATGGTPTAGAPTAGAPTAGAPTAGAPVSDPGSPASPGPATDPAEPRFPVGMPVWQAPIARAVTAGLLSLDGAEAIRRGLGGIDDAVTAEQLTAAAEHLITAINPSNPSNPSNPGNPGSAGAGRVLGADEVQRLARRLRDELDSDGIRRREKEQYDLRAVRKWRTADGMHHGIWHLHPEDGALLDSALSTILSPRRGGPRFIDPEEKAKAQKLVEDPRTDEQILADALIGMIRIATDADPGTMFGSRRPAVRVIITKKDLTTNTTPTAGTSTDASTGTGTGTGTPSGPTLPVLPVLPVLPPPSQSAQPLAPPHPAQPPLPPPPPPRLRLPGISADQGWIEGTLDPISIETIQRNLCDTGHIPVLFDDDGQCLNVGHTRRHFTARQRIALATRDGGCMFPSCDRPPSWCEAHHIKHWDRDNGPTNIDNGILLCRRHHLLLHDNHWEITNTNNNYWLQPPRNIDPTQTLILLPSRTPTITAITAIARRNASPSLSGWCETSRVMRGVLGEGGERT